MSRAMNLKLAETEVVAHCAKAKVSISAIETLASGGTHLVTTTGDGAAVMRRVLAKHLIEGTVQRYAYMQRSSASRTAAPETSPRRRD